MGDLTSYFQELMADIRYDADVSGIMTPEAFFERVKDRLTEAGELETVDRAFYDFGEGAQRLRIDGYGGDPRDAEGVLSLIVCDFKESDAPQKIGKPDLPPLFNPLIRYLKKARQTEFRDSLNEISPGFQVSDTIITTWSHITKVKLILLSNREYVGKVDAMPAGDIDGVVITFNVWDLARLEKWDGAGQASEDRTIDFAGEFGGALPALLASRASERLESYLLVIPGPQLAAIYDKWGARLLEANVRSFLQARAATNKGIAKTIRETPDLFFSFNNGISATADAIEVAKGEDGLEVASITNLQIVNGGQTTGSVHAALRMSKEKLSDVFVQMKLTVVPRDLSEDIVPKISEYANTQNKVNAADFFSNHPFHVRMQDFSRRIIAPKAEGSRHETKWFYERARGQYLDERTKRSDAQRKKFELENPKSQLFSKTDLAKFQHSASGLPHTVSTGAQKNFAAFAKATGEAWEKSDTKFDETWYKRLIAKAIIFKKLEEAIPKQSWYEGGYRANIVTYAIAKVFHDASISGKQVLDLDAVWRRQAVPEPLLRALLVASEKSAHIIASPPTGIRNMSEWAKKQACWGEVKSSVLVYEEDFDDCLIDPTEARTEVRQVRADRAMVSGIEAQIKVANAGSSLWGNLLAWGRSHRKISPKEAQTLEICASYPKKIPTEIQCQQAVSILERFKEEGFTNETA
ncbi:AIPR family protein [Rhizobium tumorigenes]|uniref:AIPR family protein n=1 Tax=Rhizobium tumorigenes TaxID=2041385 RepID=UPI00241EF19F|nr:AIPR family protein [Rhizobium tumorigenes]WFR99586.1 AIPR family protein [Rhizobium tumorigenes]